MGFKLEPLHIDGRGHLLGRLAAIVAKTLLKGQKINIYRCEAINISGSFYRNKLKYQDFMRKRTNTMPSDGPFHLRAPSKILWRVIRGMLPHKLKRGTIALKKLKTFEGVPEAYEDKKKMVIPAAMRVIRIKPGRAFCSVGRLSTEFGWKFAGAVEAGEVRRKARSRKFYLEKKRQLAKRALARKMFLAAEGSTHKAVQTLIESYGYK